MTLAAPFVHQPFVFNIGPLEVTGFGIAVLLAFAISQIVLQRELTRRGHVAEATSAPDLVLAALLGTLVGGKVYLLILNRDPSVIFSRSGFVYWGGFMMSVLFCWLWIRHKRLNFARYADVAGVSIAAGYAVGRTGCWAVGDDYGAPWDGPLATSFPNGAPPSTAQVMTTEFGAVLPPGTPPDAVIAVHPTQLYETAMGVVMFLVCWRLRDHKHAEGWLFGVYCVVAGIERFLVEFVRAKGDRFVGPFTTAQAIAIAIFAVGVFLMWVRRAPRAGAPGIYAPAA